MLWPTLQALQSLGGSGTIQEIEAKVAEIMRLTDAQLSALTNHKSGPLNAVSYNLAWARSYLKGVGAAENSSRGVWAITDKGRRLTEADTKKIPAKVRRRSRKTERTNEAPSPPSTAEPDLEGTDESWRDKLLETLQAIRPDAFERLCQRFLREAGFMQVEVTGRSGDGGIDGIGILRVSLLSFRVLFQCKRVRGRVSPKVVREFRGALVGQDRGIIITTGSFTPGARKEAAKDGAPPIDLIDGSDLCEALRQYSLGVSTVQKEVVTVRTDWFNTL